MITEKEKAKAIAKIKANCDLTELSEAMDIPVALLADWKEDLDPNDLVTLEANVHALEIVGTADKIDPNVLQDALENAALDLTKNMILPMMSGDLAHAKAIQLCADSIQKLYTTIILKNNAIITPTEGGHGDYSNKALSAFQGLLSD